MERLFNNSHCVLYCSRPEKCFSVDLQNERSVSDRKCAVSEVVWDCISANEVCVCIHVCVCCGTYERAFVF